MGFLTATFDKWRLWHLCGILSVINAIPWDISVCIWGELWKFISVCSDNQEDHWPFSLDKHTDSFQKMSAPSLQAMAFFKKNPKTALSHISMSVGGAVTLSLWSGWLSPQHYEGRGSPPLAFIYLLGSHADLGHRGKTQINMCPQHAQLGCVAGIPVHSTLRSSIHHLHFLQMEVRHEPPQLQESWQQSLWLGSRKQIADLHTGCPEYLLTVVPQAASPTFPNSKQMQLPIFHPLLSSCLAFALDLPKFSSFLRCFSRLRITEKNGKNQKRKQS